MKDGLIARLAAQVSDFYDQALKAGMTSVNIPSDWINHITAKKLHCIERVSMRFPVHQGVTTAKKSRDYKKHYET